MGSELELVRAELADLKASYEALAMDAADAAAGRFRTRLRLDALRAGVEKLAREPASYRGPVWYRQKLLALLRADEASQTVAHPPASNAPEPENKA